MDAITQLFDSLVLPILTYGSEVWYPYTKQLTGDPIEGVFLAGLPATHIARLQRIQNNAARLVLQKSKRQHVTPLLKQLRWLSIQICIDYKLATLAFRHFDGSLPQYLSSRLHQPSQSLRSSNDRFLRVPRCKLKSSCTGLSATKDLSFGTLFPLTSNSRLPWPPLNPNKKIFVQEVLFTMLR